MTKNIQLKEKQAKWLIRGKLSPAIRIVKFCLRKRKLCTKKNIKEVVEENYVSIEPV